MNHMFRKTGAPFLQSTSSRHEKLLPLLQSFAGAEAQLAGGQEQEKCAKLKKQPAVQRKAEARVLWECLTSDQQQELELRVKSAHFNDEKFAGYLCHTASPLGYDLSPLLHEQKQAEMRVNTGKSKVGRKRGEAHTGHVPAKYGSAAWYWLSQRLSALCERLRMERTLDPVGECMKYSTFIQHIQTRPTHHQYSSC